MLLTSSKSIELLKKAPIVISSSLKEWIEKRKIKIN
jgi:isopentenyl diphosphate isomerase/L-lactate dehydrogenase-like FMN-dependent dehydrogenase